MAIIGIDIGGTKIRAVLWDGRRVVRAHEFPTPKNKDDLKEGLMTLVSHLSREKSIRAIGIGAAGIVEKTTLVSSPNISYIKNFAFRPLWPRSIRLRVDNDARAFARAEFLRGAGRGVKRLSALTIGTGIGRAYGKNGKIVKLKRFEYPERWEKEYQVVRNRRDDKKLAHFLAEKLSPLLKPFEPEVVVIGGGVMERRGFSRRLEAAFKDRGPAIKIRRATFRKNGVAVGAALLLQELIPHHRIEW
ncbi:MAG: ROK family protein [Deltaproteobacteria bacterium]|nr:ROK family protein [Deltaproteobacteria bacterium]